MKKAIYNAGKNALMPFPQTKVFLKRFYRKLRTSWLRTLHPKGAFTTCNGAQVFCDFFSENYSWYDGDSEYLDYELEAFTSLFDERAPDVVLDVGAHWGFYPAFLANSMYSKTISKLISIEADPCNQKSLSKTLGKISHPPCVQVNAAISDKNGCINLYSGGGTCIQTYCSSNTVPTGQVQAICLDSLTDRFLENGESITHVKLDIDGYEPAFFAGGTQTLKRFNPIIMTEFWAKGLIVSGYDLESYWHMLENNYIIKEACFPSRRMISLESKDLAYLIGKTMEGITNLVLVPKPLSSLSES